MINGCDLLWTQSAVAVISCCSCKVIISGAGPRFHNKCKVWYMLLLRSEFCNNTRSAGAASPTTASTSTPTSAASLLRYFGRLSDRRVSSFCFWRGTAHGEASVFLLSQEIFDRFIDELHQHTKPAIGFIHILPAYGKV